MRTAIGGNEPPRRHECLSCGNAITEIRGRVVTCQKCWTVYYLPATELVARMRRHG